MTMRKKYSIKVSVTLRKQLDLSDSTEIDKDCENFTTLN